jgi:hypothetical protein
MKNLYRNSYSPFYSPPTPLFKVKLDNITIVPASLLPFKSIWQEIANNLPQGSVLICHSPANTKQKKLLDNIFSNLKSKGKSVVNMSTDEII